MKIKKLLILLIIFPLISLIFASKAFSSVQTSTAIVSGLWNSTHTWVEGRIPTVADGVTVTDGFTLYVDTIAPCRALEVRLSQFSNLVFLPDGITGSSLTISGDLVLDRGSDVTMDSNNNNDYFYLNVGGNVALQNGNSFLITADKTNSNFNVTATDIILTISDYSSSLFTSTISATSNINIYARKITIDPECSFEAYANSPSANYTITVWDEVSVALSGCFSYVINSGAGTISLNSISNEGTFTVRTVPIATTSIINIGNTLNEGYMSFIGPDPNPANISKPDPASTTRRLKLVGNYNNSYLVTSKTAVETNVGLTLENVEATNIGTFDYILPDGNEAYGICIIGLSATIEGNKSDRFRIYNCDINNSADTGLFFRNITRANNAWYTQGISSSIIRDNWRNGVWLKNVTKCDMRNCIVYNNSGSNIGYGVILTNESNQNNLSDNDIYGNKIIGLYLNNSDKNLIYNNKVHDQTPGNGQEGIYLYQSQKNVLVYNSCYSNPVHGIALEYDSINNYLAANKCSKNSEGGFRIRYNADGNIFLTNISSENTRAGFTSHSSKDTLCVEDILKNNGIGDVYIEGEENIGYLSQIWMKGCLFQSTVTFTNTPEKQEFTKSNSWVISQKHNGTNGITDVWGQFSMPQTAHNWHTPALLSYNYYNSLYSGKSHGWNTTSNVQYDTPMLRYDDGGEDGPGMPVDGTNDITSVTTSSTTKTELWIVTYNSSQNRWTVWGSSSGLQTRGGPEGTGLLRPDADYSSDNGEVRFRITHHTTPISPGEQYVFITIADSKDQNTQKKLELCDFSDPNYIGSTFTNNTGATIDFVGTSTAPTIVTRKLAQDIPDTNFYYNLNLGGIINQIKYTNFSYLDGRGLLLNAKPLVNTENIRIESLQTGTTYSTYISAVGIIDHYIDSLYIETTTVTGVYGVRADNSSIYIRDYVRPFLSDKVTGTGAVYWDPTLVYTGQTGFLADGVEPNYGSQTTAREFQVKYFDRGLTTGGNAPTTVQVWIDINDNGTYEQNERIGMKPRPGVGNDSDYSNGEVYYYILSTSTYDGDGMIAYRFFAPNPNSMTISTYTYNIYSINNIVISTFEATGFATQTSTFIIRGTPPRATVSTPNTEQSGLVVISYNLIDTDNKTAPRNYCSVLFEYKDPSTGLWSPATIGPGSEPIEDLESSTLSGTTHYYTWDSAEDLPNKDVSTSIRITPTDEDGTGSSITSGSFALDNIIGSRIIFISSEQELLTGSTSQVVTVQIQDDANNKDIDANISLTLMSNSTNYSFVSSTANILINSVLSNAGEAKFKYRDENRGQPTITVSYSGLQAASQVYYITKDVSAIKSTLSITETETVVGSSQSMVNVIVTLNDLDGNPVSGKSVLISVSGTDNFITQPTDKTNTSGIAYASFWSTKAELKTARATDSTDNILILSSDTITFTNDIVNANTSTVSVSSSLAQLGTTVNVSITLKDKYLNPVSNKQVIVQLDPPGDTILISNNITNASGQITTTVTGNSSGQKMVTATDQTDGILLASTATITFLSEFSMDISSPNVDTITPADGSTAYAEFTTVSAILSDIGSGVNFSSSTLTLTGPSGNISGTLSYTANTLTLTFESQSTNGTYTTKVTVYDDANNFTIRYSSFTLNIRNPEETFKNGTYSYPNPSTNGNVVINYSLLNTANRVTLRIYTIAGDLVREEVLDGSAGTNKTYNWDSKNQAGNFVGSGVYIIKMIAEEPTRKFSTSKKQIVIKRR
ncbi:MAG: hypothetical protein A2252_08430 [Elusimicrobia bacterium RIFOXYA2_FULL_39_19]|nr:MAG: hypothetical protein A2252_08430 [Elusimicrobia bacterium RIFOXYA2_FULL_39_19]